MGTDPNALAQKVAALCRPETYPEAPARVEVIETHMSFVFLTPRHAYKLKKPVRYAFLDFSTLELRRRHCEEELRLNKRLAAGIYLGVVPLGHGTNGRLRVGADASVVEWLVKMQRLPRERMLDERIRSAGVTDQELAALASRLARFYRCCPAEPITGAEYRLRLRAEIEIDRAALEAHANALGHRVIALTVAGLQRFVDQRRALFDQRVAAGRIVEGHGDLRPEHVCLLDEPVVFDSLEFNRNLRIVDPADELALLAVDCEHLGAPRAGAIVLQRYSERTGDQPPAALIDFYKARRASLRARLAILHLREMDGPLGERWLATSRAYLALADTYVQRSSASAANIG